MARFLARNSKPNLYGDDLRCQGEVDHFLRFGQRLNFSRDASQLNKTLLSRTFLTGQVKKFFRIKSWSKKNLRKSQSQIILFTLICVITLCGILRRKMNLPISSDGSAILVVKNLSRLVYDRQFFRRPKWVFIKPHLGHYKTWKFLFENFCNQIGTGGWQ